MAQAGRAKLQAKANKYRKAGVPENTGSAYEAAWKDFEYFCENELGGESALPASSETVALYIAYLDQQSVRTIDVKLAAIARYHKVAHLPNPTTDEDVRSVLRGLRRQLNAPPVKKEPILSDDLERMVDALPDTLVGKRDKAILLVGFMGAFRRSELVGIVVDDISFNKNGMAIALKRSKTDQEGVQDIKKDIPRLNSKMCPVEALKEWLRESGVKEGYVFRKVDKWGNVWNRKFTSQSVATIVKRTAILAGIDSKNLSGHSLRSGFVTASYKSGVPEWEIQKQTGHRNLMTLRGYNQDKGEGASNAVRTIFGEK